MRWERGHKSPDVIDRRGEGRTGGGGLGVLGAVLPLLLRTRYGWIALLLIGALGLFGGGLGGLFGGGGEQRAHGAARPGAAGPRSDDAMVEFVSFVLDDVQGTWASRFSGRDMPYRNAKLVLFTGATRSGCGTGEAAAGPFYCPADERVYIDLSFYRELEQRFGARGDFAQAYVLAHEVGHHVQHLLGTSDRVHRAPRAQQQGATGLSVRLELQADCLAGVWANATGRRDLLEQGDLEEALVAAAAIGDDRLQRSATGVVHPESWTHGSSEQRSRWLRRGYDAGTLEACDTFSAPAL